MSAQTLFFWITTGALLLLWIYITSSFGKDVFYNLYVNRARTLLYKPVTWVQSITPRCADWAAAALLFGFVLLLRAGIAKASGNPLFHRIGDQVLKADLQSFPAAAIFSAASFIVILGQANLMRLALVMRHGRQTTHPVIECLDTVTKPFSLIPPVASVITTALALMATTTAMAAASQDLPTTRVFGLVVANPLAGSALFPLKAALFATVDILQLVAGGLMVLIFISIGGLLMRNISATGMANEWLAFLSRAFISRTIGVGMLDFTPLILYYVLNFIHAPLLGIVDGLL